MIAACLPCTRAGTVGGYPTPALSPSVTGMVAPYTYATAATGTPDAPVGQVSGAPAVFTAPPPASPCRCSERAKLARVALALAVLYLLVRR